MTIKQKIKDFKEAVKHQPPDRLAKIEYQSHMLQILGVLIVCAILIYKGFWYIIFAFIFSLGISYSQGMTAYQKYNTIISLKGNEVVDFERDKSPTRRRGNIIKSVFGGYAWWFSIVLSLVLTYLLVGIATWYQKTAFAMVVLFFHIIIYFFLIYLIAYPFYRINKMEESRNGLDKSTNTKKNRRS